MLAEERPDPTRVSTDPDHTAIVRILREQELAPPEQDLLDLHLQEALSDQRRVSLPPRFRPATDRLASNLGDLVDASRARRLASQLVQHRLRARRLAATKLLRRVGVTDAEAPALRTAMLEYKDLEALELLTRAEGGLRAYNCCQLLSLTLDVDSGYLAALVIERLWRDGDLDHQHAAKLHPLAFARALGRTGDETRRPLLEAVIATAVDPILLHVCLRCGETAVFVGSRGAGPEAERSADRRNLHAIIMAVAIYEPTPQPVQTLASRDQLAPRAFAFIHLQQLPCPLIHFIPLLSAAGLSQRTSSQGLSPRNAISSDRASQRPGAR